MAQVTPHEVRRVLDEWQIIFCRLIHCDECCRGREKHSQLPSSMLYYPVYSFFSRLSSTSKMRIKCYLSVEYFRIWGLHQPFIWLLTRVAGPWVRSNHQPTSNRNVVYSDQIDAGIRRSRLSCLCLPIISIEVCCGENIVKLKSSHDWAEGAEGLDLDTTTDSVLQAVA